MNYFQNHINDQPFWNGSATAGTSTAMNLDECSSGFQSASLSNFPSELPSSASTTINEFPPYRQASSSIFEAVSELVNKFICNENDKEILTNSLATLFSYTIDCAHGPEVCQLITANPAWLKALYYILTNEQFKDDELILFFATGNLTNLTKYNAGRAALVGFDDTHDNRYMAGGSGGTSGSDASGGSDVSDGVKSIINSLKSRDSNVVFAITALHNLLLDSRVLETAKEQIRRAQGIQHIVRQLANQNLVNNYEFKVIVLNCLQIIAYRNPENQRIILESDGPRLILHTIMENFDHQPTEELVLTASRALKFLSSHSDNKMSIIQNNGVQILTRCIECDNQDILKTCLWTLRNLSDVIIRTSRVDYIGLIERLLRILDEYVLENCIVTCTLGILANLTCNNEPIKKFICKNHGIDLILEAIEVAFRVRLSEFNQILEEATCALWHLLNQADSPELDSYRQQVRDRFLHDPAFQSIGWEGTAEEMSEDMKQLVKLIGIEQI